MPTTVSRLKGPNFMRITSSFIWALLIAGGVLAWMFSDDYIGGEADNFSEMVEQATQIDAEDNAPNFIVSALQVVNAQTAVLVRASGVTEPSFRQPILARRSGVIVSLPAEEGMRISAGDMLAELDSGTLQSDLAAAQADRDAAVKSYEASKKLVSRNLSTELDLVRAVATLRNSEALIAQIQEQQSFTIISAPQSGRLEALDVRIGEVVMPNQRIGLLLGLDNLFLTMPVPQAQIAQIKIGNPVRVDIAGFGLYEGKVYRISNESNEATRTFDVEVLINNQSGALKSGMSAEAAIIVDQLPAFAVSPAHLSVTGDGVLSAKIADNAGQVQLKPVQLVKTENNLAYIAGLQDGDVLLTTGQAFLADGEAVIYKLENEVQ